jgi:hypothetical protein
MNEKVAKCLLIAKVLVADGIMTDDERSFLDGVMAAEGLDADERRRVTELDGGGARRVAGMVNRGGELPGHGPSHRRDHEDTELVHALDRRQQAGLRGAHRVDRIDRDAVVTRQGRHGSRAGVVKRSRCRRPPAARTALRRIRGGAGACCAQVQRTGRPAVRSEVRRRHRVVPAQRPGPRPARAVSALHRDRT